MDNTRPDPSTWTVAQCRGWLDDNQLAAASQLQDLDALRDTVRDNARPGPSTWTSVQCLAYLRDIGVDWSTVEAEYHDPPKDDPEYWVTPLRAIVRDNAKRAQKESRAETMAQFTARHRITLSSERVSLNPHMADVIDGSHWRCRIRYDRRSMTVYFSQGSAHTKDPTVVDVLSCLAGDAQAYDNAESFEDWADEFGLDVDSRRAEKTYRVIEKQNEGLRRVLADVYSAALHDVEPE